MRFYSPLRYPGGKSKLTAYILETIKLNQLEGGTYVEPFAGGAAIAWYLLVEGHVNNLFINDLNPSIFAFWHSVLFDTNNLCSLIENTSVEINEWHKQREIYLSKNSTLLERGFSAFFLNRTNRSGIIMGGVIGGLDQSGNYKLDCRYNKKRLIDQIQTIASHKNNIHLSNLDAIEFLDDILPNVEEKCLVNIDPPYYVKGKGLYQDFFKHEDHCRLFESVKRIKQPWIVTYDDTPEINDIYSEFSPQPYGLSYTAQLKRKGTEVMIHKPTMELCKHKPDITFNELKKLKRSISTDNETTLNT